MQILVLGASSAVGAALAEKFAPGNKLLLAGRHSARLALCAEQCLRRGAALAECIEQDFALGVGPLRERLQNFPLDLIIDAASASSRKRDPVLQAADLRALVKADFQSKAELLEDVLPRQDRAPAVIFISTVLTLVRSPQRSVYTSLKTLHEIYLKKLSADHPDMRLLIVRIGSVLDTEGVTEKHRRMAASVRTAFEQRHQSLFLGLAGLAFVALFYLQPVIFAGIATLRRKLGR